MKFSKEKEESIISDYKAGLNTVEIAKKWNTYNTSIRRVLLRYGITLRSTKEVQRTVENNPFKLGDEKSEYFLGLLLTDGNIYHRKDCNSVRITISLKDKEMVEQFRDFVCPRTKVSKVLQKKYNTYMFTSTVRHDEIANWLEQQGNFHNKSYECDIYIPLTQHILRGIFDGDGYWHTTNNRNTIQWGICGKSLIFLNKIKAYLTENNIESHLYKRDNPNGYLYYLEITKTVDVIRVANLMYKEAHMSLIRKYEKWHLFEETLREKFPKFKEGAASPNPEPSLNKLNNLYNTKNGRFIMEGAETIMELLNT
ncbi:MAG: LAGLIDADG family homing endonuclease [Bacteroidales bacterium]